MIKKIISILCDGSKKYHEEKKFTHRNAWETKWFGLLTLVPPSRAIHAFFLSTKILVLCFGAVFTRCLFDAVVLVQASVALRTLASINMAESFERTVSALGSASCRSDRVTWTLVASRAEAADVNVLAYLTCFAKKWDRARGVVILSRWAAEETSLAACKICWYSFSLP